MRSPLSRRDVLRAAAAAGLTTPLLAACGDRPPPGAATPDTSASGASASGASSLGHDTLALGLMALAHAHHRGWARGHHGAAVIASYYFSREHELDERTLRALRGQVEAFVRSRKKEFPPLRPGPGRADTGPILEQLSAHIHELRSGGHDAIYASLALRALQELPHYATPKVVDGIRKLLVSFVETLPVVEETPWQRTHEVPPFADAGELTTATLDGLLRPWEEVSELGAGQVVHWVTHADAVLTLGELGHESIARAAYGPHQRYLHHARGGGTGDGPAVETVDWLGPTYWESDAPRTPQKGTWFFGHSFKLPYSLLRLLRDERDAERRAACLHRASQLHVPFP